MPLTKIYFYSPRVNQDWLYYTISLVPIYLDAALKKTNRQLEKGTISPYVAEQRLNEFLATRDALIGQTQKDYGVTINVNSASIIDENGFTRAVVDALNSVERRQAGGASALVGL